MAAVQQKMPVRRGMDGLLRVLGDQPHPDSFNEEEWRHILARAAEENLLPWIAARLNDHPLPPRVSSAVADIRREARHKAFAWSAALKQILSAFHDRGLQVIALKGPWLAERLYGDRALRSYADLDFLVKPGDWNAVEDVLRALGFSPRGAADHRNRHWHQAWIHVEPHFQLSNPYDFDWDVADVWPRAQSSTFDGVPGWLLAPSDELAYLSVHAVTHCFERLSLLLDLNLAFAQLPLPDELPSTSPSEVQNALIVSRMLANRLNAPGVSKNTLPKWIAPRPHLSHVAEQVWQRFMLRPALPTWRTTRRFSIELEPPGWPRFERRLRYLRVLVQVGFNRMTDVSEPDFAFAARFHVRRRWVVALLRPLRLLVAGLRKSIYG